MNSESSSNPSRAMKSSVKVLPAASPDETPRMRAAAGLNTVIAPPRSTTITPSSRWSSTAPVDAGVPRRHRPTCSTSMFQVSSVVPSVRSNAVSAFS